MQHPTNFGQVTSPIIATYNGTDVAQGIGTAVFYLTDDIKGTEFATPDSGTYSFKGYWDNNTDGAGDLDFDITIQNPVTYEGQAIFTVFVTDQSNASSHTPTVGVKIRKYSGTTETDLVTDSTTVSLSSTVRWVAATFKLTLPETYFNIGDILRFTLTITQAPSALAVARLRFDPSNVNSTATFKSTASYVVMPVKIE